MRTKLLLILMILFIVQPILAQKGKLRKNVYTSPGKEFEISFSYFLGKPRLHEEYKGKELSALAIADDECRTFSLELYGSTALSLEEWEQQNTDFQSFKRLFSSSTSFSKIETVYGKTEFYEYVLPEGAPCMTLSNDGAGGGWVKQKPDANVGVALLKIDGSIYCFSYAIAVEPPNMLSRLESVDRELVKFINGFKILKPRKAT